MAASRLLVMRITVLAAPKSRCISFPAAAKRTREVMAIQDVTILAMASLAETRDNETGGHIVRTQHYVRLLAQELRRALRARPAPAPRFTDPIEEPAAK